jgi:hypothetical protein
LQYTLFPRLRWEKWFSFGERPPLDLSKTTVRDAIDSPNPQAGCLSQDQLVGRYFSIASQTVAAQAVSAVIPVETVAAQVVSAVIPHGGCVRRLPISKRIPQHSFANTPQESFISVLAKSRYPHTMTRAHH